jgi:nucleotide-binding universal stress UspA family protein
MAPRSKDTEVTAARALPFDVGRVVAFLDGSPFAERALPVASWIAGELRVGLELIEVVSGHGDGDRAVRYLCGTANRRRASSWDVIVHEDVPAAMAEVVGHRRGALPCLATHGRDRSAALLGSTAEALLARSPRPVLLAGPKAGPREDPGAPVVVVVDGSAADDALMPVATAWAVRLRRHLVITTLAQPAPPGQRTRAAPRRARGPADPDAHLAELVDRAAASGVEVTSDIAYDGGSVRDGLASTLDRRAALLVLGTHHHHGLGRIVFGSHAARVVHDATIPALVVPSTSVEETTAAFPRFALSPVD